MFFYDQKRGRDSFVDKYDCQNLMSYTDVNFVNSLVNLTRTSFKTDTKFWMLDLRFPIEVNSNFLVFLPKRVKCGRRERALGTPPISNFLSVLYTATDNTV